LSKKGRIAGLLSSNLDFLHASPISTQISNNVMAAIAFLGIF
jgi:hypothetical protein